MSEIIGENILEVWDYRLSTAKPRIIRKAGTWVAEIWSKSLPDHIPAHVERDYDDDGGPIAGTERKIPATKSAEPLETFDTGVTAESLTNPDQKTVIAYFEWLLSVRDKYSLPDIEGLKPKVADIRKTQAEIAETQAGLSHSESVEAWQFIKEVKRIADERGIGVNTAFKIMVSSMSGSET